MMCKLERRENAACIMQLEIEGDILIASWPDLQSVNSPEFFKSFVSLLVYIRAHHICKVILDSGQPQGGIVSDSVINFGIKVVPFTTLKRIALLESTDYYWNDSLLQIFKYLNEAVGFTLETKLFSTKGEALYWLTE